MLLDSAERDPAALALRDGRTVTYGELGDRAGAVAAEAADLGLESGDRVLLIGPASAEWVAAYYGLIGAGLIVVTANVMSTQVELEYLFDDAGCSLAVAGEGVEAVLEAAACGRCPARMLREVGDRDGDTAAERGALHGGGDDTAVLLYTSGTTGRPKGTELTHANLIAAAELSLAGFEIAPEDSVLVALPLSHVFGQSVLLNTGVLAGAALTLQPRFDPDQALRLMVRDRISVFAGVPTMYNAMLRCASAGEVDLRSTLRLAVSGGAPMPVEILRQFEQRFGTPIIEGYGMTETTGVGVFNRLDRRRKVGKVGMPLDGIEIRIVDENDVDVPSGGVGELLVAGPVVTKGYWERPAETAEVLRAGWLRTGDLATRDEDGDVAIVDRKKELIIRGGYNVYPREVEEVLSEHPDVVEVVVTGVDHPHYGQEVAAAIVLGPGSELDAEGLTSWSKERMSAYKYPRIIRFVEELPKSANGKLLRRAVSFDEESAKSADGDE